MKTVILLGLVALGLGCAQEDIAPSVEVVAVNDKYRLVRHPLGETHVPVNPQRMATLIPGGGVDYFLNRMTRVQPAVRGGCVFHEDVHSLEEL